MKSQNLKVKNAIQKSKTISFLLTVFTAVFLLWPLNFVYAQTNLYDNYIWNYNTLTTVSPGAIDLQTKLNDEVQKVVNSGHLAPWRTLYGKNNARYFYYNRFDTVYVLSLAYPYLSSNMQIAAKSYLQSELQNYPVWIDTYTQRFLPFNVGTRREAELIPAGVVNNETAGYEYWLANQPKLFAIYALWLYAQNTGDWQYIQNNYPTITNWYNANRLETAKYYQSIAGSIGMARIAQHFNDAATKNTATTDVENGMTAGTNFLQFAQQAEIFFGGTTPIDAWTLGDKVNPGYTIYPGFQFEYMTPEIGQYIADNPTLKNLAIGTNTADASYIFSINNGESYDPLWYVSKTAIFTHVYSEGMGTYPGYKAMIFPVLNFVSKTSPSILRQYLDVPDARPGDYFYLQNLAYTIQAYVNVPLPSSSCPKLLLGDLNCSGKVDLFDYNTLVSNFGKSGVGISGGDLNNNGTVDLFDYNILVSNFGK